MEGRKINPASLNEKTSLVLILAGAFLLQAVLQGATEGYSYDMGCFYAWAGRLASLGPGEFYSPDYFADYPPGGILALYPAGIIRNLLGLEMDSVAWKLVLGFLPALAVCGIAYLTWSQARRVMDSSLALRLTALVAFNPALLYAMGIWKQVDSLFLLALAASFVQLERKRYLRTGSQPETSGSPGRSHSGPGFPGASEKGPGKGAQKSFGRSRRFGGNRSGYRPAFLWDPGIE